MNKDELLSMAIRFSDEVFFEYKTNINYGDYIVKRVLLGLFRKVIELSDGVWVCADNQLHCPTELNYRGLVEAYLAFMYIVQDEKLSKNRAIAYTIGYHSFQIKALNNPITKKNRKDLVERALPYHDGELKKKEYAEVLKEHNKTKKENKGYLPKWYSLYDGPRSVNELAKCIENDGENNLIHKLYGSLSNNAHMFLATNAFIEPKPDSIMLDVKVPYIGDELQLSRAILMRTTQIFIKSCFPRWEDSFFEFYLFILNEESK